MTSQVLHLERWIDTLAARAHHGDRPASAPQ